MKKWICILVLSSAPSLLAQLQVKNSLSNPVTTVTQSGLVGIATSTPTARLHAISSNPMVLPYWNLTANVVVHARETSLADNSTNHLLVGQFTASSSGSTVLATGSRLALQAALINNTEPAATRQVSQAALGYQHHSQKLIAGMTADIYSAPQIPSGYTTAAGHFKNERSGSTDFGIAVEGNSASFFSQKVGIGTSAPTAQMHVKSSQPMSIPAWGTAANVSVYGEEMGWSDAQNGILLVGQFTASSSGSSTPTGARIALQGSLVNKNDPLSSNQIAQASIGYQHMSQQYMSGISADIYDTATIPAGFKTFAGHFHNRRTTGNDVGIYIEGGKTPIQTVGMPLYNDNASARSGGVPVGGFYRDSNGFVRIAL